MGKIPEGASLVELRRLRLLLELREELSVAVVAARALAPPGADVEVWFYGEWRTVKGGWTTTADMRRKGGAVHATNEANKQSAIVWGRG